MATAAVRTYRIRLERHLGPAAAAHFPEFELRHDADGTTVLTGAVTDQAALHGVLARVRDLGLALREVLPVDAGDPQA